MGKLCVEPQLLAEAALVPDDVGGYVLEPAAPPVATGAPARPYLA
ncbi:hypothetical protein [Micromonospora sp. NPDC023888]